MRLISVHRRQLLLATGGLLAVPFARAQVAHRVAWLSVNDPAAGRAFLNHFVEAMSALGYGEGRNLMLDASWGNNSSEMLDRLALEAAASKPAVIVTHGPALLSARKIPGTIPVVFGYSGDPVELGVAKSLARPGGKFTGVTFLAYELAGKRVELLREVLPRLNRLAVLSNPHHAGDAKEFAATSDAATRFQLDLSHYTAGNPFEVERALAAIAAARAEAILMHPDALIVQQRETIARFSVQYRIPAISGWAALAESGVLLTYGPVLQESSRRLAYFVDRILRGANPADLPIELPTKLELVINLKTARALDLTIPKTVLLRADRVIE